MAERQLKVDLTPSIKKLEIVAKKMSTSQVVGAYRSIFRGFGLDFSEYREYTQDDDAEKIDWKASNRSNSLLVRDYEEERNLNIFFIVDVSENMVFGSTDKLKNEYSAEVAVSLAHVALKAGDKVGFSLFAGQPIKKAAPSRNKNIFYSFSKELVNPDNYYGNFDLIQVLKFIESYLPKNSLVMLISDFIGLDPNWATHVKPILARFDLIFLIVRDPRDYSLPEDSFQVVVSDPKTQDQIIVEPAKIKQAYEDLAKKELEEFKSQISGIGADYAELRTDQPFLEPIMILFKKRKVKWR